MKIINKNYQGLFMHNRNEKQMIWKELRVYHTSHSFVRCCRLADRPSAFRQTFR